MFSWTLSHLNPIHVFLKIPFCICHDTLYFTSLNTSFKQNNLHPIFFSSSKTSPPLWTIRQNKPPLLPTLNIGDHRQKGKEIHRTVCFKNKTSCLLYPTSTFHKLRISCLLRLFCSSIERFPLRKRKAWLFFGLGFEDGFGGEFGFLGLFGEVWYKVEKKRFWSCLWKRNFRSIWKKFWVSSKKLDF